MYWILRAWRVSNYSFQPIQNNKQNGTIRKCNWNGFIFTHLLHHQIYNHGLLALFAAMMEWHCREKSDSKEKKNKIRIFPYYLVITQPYIVIFARRFAYKYLKRMHSIYLSVGKVFFTIYSYIFFFSCIRYLCFGCCSLFLFFFHRCFSKLYFSRK